MIPKNLGVIQCVEHKHCSWRKKYANSQFIVAPLLKTLVYLKIKLLNAK